MRRKLALFFKCVASPFIALFGYVRKEPRDTHLFVAFVTLGAGLKIWFDVGVSLTIVGAVLLLLGIFGEHK